MITDILSEVYLIEKRRQFLNFNPVFPQQIDLEATNACNLKCPICPQPKQTRKIGVLSFDLARKIIIEVNKYGLERMCLSVIGEPFLNKDFFDISRYAAASGKIKHKFISTNGLLMDRNVSEELLTSGLDKIIISIDGASKETYQKVRVGGDFDRVVNNVLGFLEARKKHNKVKPGLALQIIRMDETRQEIDSFKNFWISRIGHQDQLDVKEHFTWAGKVENRSVNRKFRIKVKTPCVVYLWSNMVIHWNGDITACCYDSNGELVLGNAQKDSIYDIWHGEKYRKLRSAHLQGLIQNIPVCANCEFSHRKLEIKDFFGAIKRRVVG